jgi:hypothetical protein
MKSYIDPIKFYFNFLIDDFGFEIIKVVDKSKNMINKVEFSSPSTFFYIGVLRYEISTQIRPINEPEVSSLSLYSIIEYFSKTKTSSTYVTPAIKDIEKTLGLLAIKMKEYCRPFLIGDFSQWNKLLLWFYKEINREYSDATGRKLPDQALPLTQYLRSKNVIK